MKTNEKIINKSKATWAYLFTIGNFKPEEKKRG